MDWEEVKPKKKVKKVNVKPPEEKDPMYLGGGTGPFVLSQSAQGSGSAPGYVAPKPKKHVDDEEEKDEEIKIELISHVCSEDVKKARMAKGLNQADLAKKINVKVSVIHEIENGTAHYNADLINKIANVTGAKINRG